MSILSLDAELTVHKKLSPSLLHSVYKEAYEPISVFYLLRPSEVLRYCPSAIGDLDTKTDLGEGRVPVGRQLGLVSQTQSPLQEGCIQLYRSSTRSHNERCFEKKTKV